MAGGLLAGGLLAGGFLAGGRSAIAAAQRPLAPPAQAVHPTDTQTSFSNS
jgi:hypothetical protein